VDFSAVTHVAKDKGIPPFVLLYFSGNPDTRARAQRLESVLKEAEIPAKAYGKRDSNHSRLRRTLCQNTFLCRLIAFAYTVATWIRRGLHIHPAVA
jgi:hypothetical protein